MRVVLRDGTELSCENFKAIDSGVLLTKDKKRKKVIGFVPHQQIKYVVPDDLEPIETTLPETDHSGDGGDEAARETVAETRADETLVVGPSDGLTDTAETPDTSDLRRLGGVGSTYAERLRAAGYETLADIAAADPAAVADAASVAPGRGRRWVTAARRAVADEVDTDGDNSGDDEGANASPDSNVEE